MEALKRTTAEVLSVSPLDNQYEERILLLIVRGER